MPGLPRLLQISGDLEDLELALNKSKTRATLGSGSCSALLKLLPGQRDLLVAHNTWNAYQYMLRVLKKYQLQFRVGPRGGWTRCTRPCEQPGPLLWQWVSRESHSNTSSFWGVLEIEAGPGAH